MFLGHVSKGNGAPDTPVLIVKVSVYSESHAIEEEIRHYR